MRNAGCVHCMQYRHLCMSVAWKTLDALGSNNSGEEHWHVNIYSFGHLFPSTKSASGLSARSPLRILSTIWHSCGLFVLFFSIFVCCFFRCNVLNHGSKSLKCVFCFLLKMRQMIYTQYLCSTFKIIQVIFWYHWLNLGIQYHGVSRCFTQSEDWGMPRSHKNSLMERVNLTLTIRKFKSVITPVMSITNIEYLYLMSFTKHVHRRGCKPNLNLFRLALQHPCHPACQLSPWSRSSCSREIVDFTSNRPSAKRKYINYSIIVKTWTQRPYSSVLLHTHSLFLGETEILQIDVLQHVLNGAHQRPLLYSSKKCLNTETLWAMVQMFQSLRKDACSVGQALNRHLTGGKTF